MRNLTRYGVSPRGFHFNLIIELAAREWLMRPCFGSSQVSADKKTAPMLRNRSCLLRLLCPRCEAHRFQGRASEPAVAEVPAMAEMQTVVPVAIAVVVPTTEAVMASEMSMPITMPHFNDGVGGRRGDCRRRHEVSGRGLLGRGKKAPEEGNGDGELLDQGRLRVSPALSSPVNKNEPPAWRLQTFRQWQRLLSLR